MENGKRQSKQVLLGYVAPFRILSTLCLTVSCNDIFLVVRGRGLSGLQPFGLTKVDVQLMPHNNQ